MEWQARLSQVGKAQKAARPAQPIAPGGRTPVAPDVHEGTMKPLWAGSLLLLARTVAVGGEDYVQG